MQDALRAMNRLVEGGVIETYAIGGAMAAAFYIEAMQTEDVDAFIFLPQSAGGLISLSPIYSALEKFGGEVEREYVRFGEWPLQILPDTTSLVGDAIREAVTVTFEGVQTRIFKAEHLCAIALETGRAKDLLRVRMFLDQNCVDVAALRMLASQYKLENRLLRVEALADGKD